MTPFVQDPDLTIHVGDVREVLAELPDGSVDCVITSPPYWGLRDYGTGSWEGGDPDCDHKTGRYARNDGDRNGEDGFAGSQNREGHAHMGELLFRELCGKCGATRNDRQLGLEPTPELYVQNMVAVFREVRRVLADHGTCWVNLGDSYNGQGGTGREGKGMEHGQWMPPVGSRTFTPSLKPKDLVGIPWRVAFALQADGWCLRSDIVWSKPNPMPESVTDRPTKAHEFVFLLTKAKWLGIENPLRLDRADAMWLAAMMDGEGTICVNKRKGRTEDQVTYSAALRCYNSSRAIIERVAELAGCGTVTHKPGAGDYRDIWQWQCGGQTAVPVLDAIEPYLIAKQQQAHLLLELQGMRRHHGSRPGWGTGANRRPAILTKRQEEISRGCSELNRTGSTDVQVFPWKRGNWKPLPYAFDQEAVRESAVETGDLGILRSKKAADGQGPTSRASIQKRIDAGADPRAGGLHLNGKRNVRSVWEIATQPYAEAHFATYPEELVRRCLLAGCPEWVCGVCGVPRSRIVDGTKYEPPVVEAGVRFVDDSRGDKTRKLSGAAYNAQVRRETVGWSDCGHDAYQPGIVLDPFGGSGTTAVVARRFGRHAILIELNPEYARMAAQRLSQLSLRAEGAA